MSDIKITKHRNWQGAGKGDQLRPGADLGKFRDGWDRIFRKCKVCNGSGIIQYDETHCRPCDECCKHGGGFWELSEMFAGYLPGADNRSCKLCGKMFRDFPDGTRAKGEPWTG